MLSLDTFNFNLIVYDQSFMCSQLGKRGDKTHTKRSFKSLQKEGLRPGQ